MNRKHDEEKVERYKILVENLIEWTKDIHHENEEERAALLLYSCKMIISSFLTKFHPNDRAKVIEMVCANIHKELYEFNEQSLSE
jgi:hypothetical protein